MISIRNIQYIKMDESNYEPVMDTIYNIQVCEYEDLN